MKKYINGKYIDITQEERAQLYKEVNKEKNRPFTEAEVSLLFITQQINTLSVDDNTSLRMLAYYPEWAVNNSYSIGYKVQRNGKLYRAIQAHTSVEGWEPELALSLWEQINETHAGTLEDAIPYSGNMALEKDKYYYDKDYVMYLCTRDSINPVYNPLFELVGLYVEVV